MPDSVRQFLESALDVIEEREAGLLVWGVVDGCFSKAELSESIDPLIEKALDQGNHEFLDANAVIEELLRLQWIVEVEPVNLQARFRSRMAETIRLLLRLRQLFPKHGKSDLGWQDAPTLVSDFRFHRRRRQFAKRGVSLDETLANIRSVTRDPSLLAGVKAILESSTSLISSGLARFQVRSIQRVLRALESGKALATIISAGTGSGKTLAFYIPALASILRHRIRDTGPNTWVKVVAIYPRVELLKDQLHEVLGRVLALVSAINTDEKPVIRVGALFGDTPISASMCSWPKAGPDRICPLLRCLKCSGELRWTVADFSVGRERLICRSADCNFTIDGSVFPLTRESLAKSPPDILFSTTEMLNQRLSDNRLGHLFGVGSNASRAPELVLLDEVHTYESRTGAQVAYLMRRWRGLLKENLRFVGLSATLREATSFFASLTGMPRTYVEEISPQGDELLSEGAEYLVALRGDPVSRAALLSTTIQSAMLIQRCLDPKTNNMRQGLSEGVFGQRTFVFTDDLDVTNRLYFNLLDAEGRDSSGRPNMVGSPQGGLAYLRRSGMSRMRYYAGQDWRMCEALGHQLSNRLIVKRVSSQDRGINVEADLVVTTAALEVGFDDPLVGAVIQHKAPRGTAGYLQRKGRAGRLRGMRPWMVIVLSDYGRDRVAYQNYDLLFDPELPVRTLPLSNRYVTRMQATYATIDYFGRRLQDSQKGSVWRDLTAPPRSDVRKARLVREIRQILETDYGAKHFSDYLRKALDLPPEEVAALLWEYPRPLMTTVLPTALRRLESGWRAQGELEADFQVKNNPLPEFVPATLFSDLNLAEVRIELPNQSQGVDSDDSMSLFAALREFAPGRVSRRFGVSHRRERYWLPIPSQALTGGGTCELNLQDLGGMLKVGDFSISIDGGTSKIPVYRPRNLVAHRVPPNITDTSNARLIWHSQLVPLGEGTWLSPPSESVWNSIVQRVGFFMHASQEPVEVRRFANGSIAEIGIGKAPRQRISAQFEVNGLRAAIGGAFAADGVVFQISLPQDLHAREPGNHAKWRALRTARFIDEAWRGVSLPNVTNPFLREWLAQIQFSAITYEAIQKGVPLEVAAASVADGTAAISLSHVLAVLFQSQVIEVDEEQVQLGGQDRLRHDLQALLSDPLVQQELRNMSVRLWQPITNEWELWLGRVYHATLGAAFLRALSDICPMVDVNDLVVDLDRGPSEDVEHAEFATSEIWITEQSPGGNGFIEVFMRNYSQDPRRFFSTARTALEMGEFELIDHQVTRLINILASNQIDSGTRDVIAQMRSTNRHDALIQLTKQLRTQMVAEGFSPFHGFLVSVANRMLRPGAGPATDAYLASALTRWKEEEERLGIEIDLRVLCYWLSQSADIDSVVNEVGIPEGAEQGAWRMSAIYGLLWARGRSTRQVPLQIRHPYVELPPLERLIVIETVRDDRIRVSVEDEKWLEITSELLASGRMVTLICRETSRAQLGHALGVLVCNPVETGYLRSYARLQGIRQVVDKVEADIELVEAIQ